MLLQGRTLARGMQGQDVLMLKVELVLLGFDVGVGATPPTHVPANEPTLDAFDAAVEQAVRDFQAQNNLLITGRVDEPTAVRINDAVAHTDRFAVLGTVRFADGQPVSGIRVRALDRDLPSIEEERGVTQLGEAVANQRGAYLILYRKDQFAEAEEGYADLQVELLETHDGNGDPVTSDIYYDAPHVQRIDLALHPGQVREASGVRSEYERGSQPQSRSSAISRSTG